jgi:hypothetical protein
MYTYYFYDKEIPNDDKLVIRKKLKQEDEEIFALFEIHKR